MRKSILGAAIAALLLGTTPVSAHHAFSKDFDREQPVTLTGTVDVGNNSIWVNQGTLLFDTGTTVNSNFFNSIGQLGNDVGTVIAQGSAQYTVRHDFNVAMGKNFPPYRQLMLAVLWRRAAARLRSRRPTSSPRLVQRRTPVRRRRPLRRQTPVRSRTRAQSRTSERLT